MMGKKIGIGVAVVLVGFVTVVAMQPSQYSIERSATINAPAEVVWDEVANFEQWEDWSHWAKEDPEQKTTITGTPGEVGHKSEWDGEKSGKGNMTIAEAKKPNHLGLQLVFISPMAGEATNTIDIEPEGDDAVKVTWGMEGHNNFVAKMFGLFMDMETMIGGAFDSSLANLKVTAEENATKLAEAQAAEGEEALPAEGESPEGEEAQPQEL